MLDDGKVEFRKDGTHLKHMRWYLYGGTLVGLLVPLFIGGLTANAWIAAAGAMLLLCVAIDRLILAKVPADGSVLFTLDREGIESPLFEGKVKRFRWAEVLGSELVQVQGQPLLQLILTTSAERPDKRHFLSGRNPAYPRAPLQMLAPRSQEALLDAVAARLRPGAPQPIGAPVNRQASNELRASRELQERLKALAPQTWVTWALIAANTGVWLAMVAQGMNWSNSDPATLYAWGANATSAVQAGEWWRLLAAAFLHGSVLHLVLNMVGLLTVGQMVERIYGRAQFLLIYLVTAVAGSVASLYFSAQTHVSVGASGAVFGIAGALLVAVLQHREALPRAFSRQILSGMGVFVAYSLLQGFTQPNIDNAAHVGGLLAGALAALVLPERFDAAHHRERWVGRSLVFAVLAATGLHWAARTAPPAQVNLAAQVQAVQEFPRIAASFDEAMQALRTDALAEKAGKRSPQEADQRYRVLHAPAWASLVQRLQDSMPHLPARQQELGAALLSLSRALHESLVMPSVVVNGQLEPVDAARMKVLQQQMQAATQRMAEIRERNTRAR